MKTNSFTFGVLSDVGNVKKVNQDKVLIKIGEDSYGEFGLFAVADGMGGYADGEVASKMVIDNLQKWWHDILPPLLLETKMKIIDTVGKTLDDIMWETNTEIINYSRGIGKTVGTTISLIFIYRNRFIIKHIGDSRVYTVSDKIIQLTEDHSWVAEQVKKGYISKEEANIHPRRHVLTRCLGIHESIEIFETSGKTHKNHIFMLCSDGLYKLLSESEIINTIYDEDYTAQEAVKRLSDLVKSRGERDNVSAILIYTEKEDKKGILSLLKGILSR